MVTKKDSTSASENRKGRARVGTLSLNKETVKDLTAQDLKRVKGGLVVNTIIGVILPMLLPAVQKTQGCPPVKK